MSKPIKVHELTADELRELLADAGTSLSPEQAQQLSAFVAQVGGLENALAALAQLTSPSKAA